jgi:hypothetical protein
MRNAHQFLLEECRKHALTLPCLDRALFYRGLAEICGSPADQLQLTGMAEEIEAADLRCREFRFITLHPKG